MCKPNSVQYWTNGLIEENCEQLYSRNKKGLNQAGVAFRVAPSGVKKHFK